MLKTVNKPFIVLIRRLLLILLTLPVAATVIGQDKDSLDVHGAANYYDSGRYQRQHDLVDVTLFLLHGKYNSRSTDPGITDTKVYITAAPIIEYTIATGFLAGAVGNIAFKRSVIVPTNTSFVLAELKYSQKKQVLVPVESSYWTTGNKYNWLGDWRYLDYVQDSYGLGGSTKASDKYYLKYKYLRFSEIVLKRIRNNVYAGAGYQLDYHWNITESGLPYGAVTDFQRYGFATHSVSSGITAVVQYDSRDNAINPAGGALYAKLQVVENRKWTGSTTSSAGLTVDLRKYVAVRKTNVLAFWVYAALTLSGNPPYLDLPGTGTDTYNNIGRGYEQNRYTGRHLLYAETEYRFGITRDGLLGGVLFGNVQSVSEPAGNAFPYLLPGAGVGLRLKFNKFSRTNVCIDYGRGVHGSGGFAGNLGEVF